jgi:hypothetical protein
LAAGDAAEPSLETAEISIVICQTSSRAFQLAGWDTFAAAVALAITWLA